MGAPAGGPTKSPSWPEEHPGPEPRAPRRNRPQVPAGSSSRQGPLARRIERQQALRRPRALGAGRLQRGGRAAEAPVQARAARSPLPVAARGPPPRSGSPWSRPEQGRKSVARAGEPRCAGSEPTAPPPRRRRLSLQDGRSRGGRGECAPPRFRFRCAVLRGGRSSPPGGRRLRLAAASRPAGARAPARAHWRAAPWAGRAAPAAPAPRLAAPALGAYVSPPIWSRRGAVLGILPPQRCRRAAQGSSDPPPCALPPHEPRPRAGRANPRKTSSVKGRPWRCPRELLLEFTGTPTLPPATLQRMGPTPARGARVPA